MRSNVLNSTTREVRYWWTSLLAGVLIVVLGIWCFATSDRTLVRLATLFTITFFASGLLEIFFSYANRRTFSDWGWSLTGGVIDIAFGAFMLLLARPVIESNLLYIVGFWAVLHAVGAIFQAIDMKNIALASNNWLLWFAVLSGISALIFVLTPLLASGRFIIAFIAIALSFYGLFKVNVSFKLRAFNEEKEISQEAY